MRRKAILLSHEDEILASNKDVSDVERFLLSYTGGAWKSSEIIAKPNISLQALRMLIKKIQDEGVDYLFFYFSGHGGYVRDTVIELNPSGEVISERDISKIVPRQINIFDCCRVRAEPLKIWNSMDSLSESRNLIKEVVREKFERRVMEALPQQLSLYACQVGESAFDFGKGGIYTQNLLMTTKSFTSEFLLALQAHNLAYQPTVAAAALRREKQHPDYFAGKYLSRYQLPLALNLNII